MPFDSGIDALCRADSEAFTGHIYDRLVGEFGTSNVFKDVDNIPLGRDFRMVVQESIRASGAVPVIIGREWLTIRASDGTRRLDDPADPVRLEVAEALNRRGLVIIPVLVNGAAIPPPDLLPDDIASLPTRTPPSSAT